MDGATEVEEFIANLEEELSCWSEQVHNSKKG